MRGIKKDIELHWNGRQYKFEPGIPRGNNLFDSGVSVNVPTNTMEREKALLFSFQLDLNGSEGLYFLPMGRNTSVQLHSPWQSPSFDGAFLPESRKVSSDGFSADWKALDLNRNYPQYWVGESARGDLGSSSFGFKLFSPVNQYTKTSRAVKYLFMFVILTFLVFFLMEVFNNKRIHPVQYLLVGMALCIFFVLLLSISEHLNFELAYIIAGLSVVLLISSYIRSALGGMKPAIICFVLLSILYGYLYILLQNADFALLMGSIGTFAILAIVMYFSRRIDWYSVDLNG